MLTEYEIGEIQKRLVNLESTLADTCSLFNDRKELIGLLLKHGCHRWGCSGSDRSCHEEDDGYICGCDELKKKLEEKP